MKKISLKLKNAQKSQPSISSFFSKNSQTALVVKNEISNFENDVEKNKKKTNSEYEEKNNFYNPSNVDNKKLSTKILLKGKYYGSDDQNVPDVALSPSKKAKLSFGSYISTENEKKMETNENSEIEHLEICPLQNQTTEKVSKEFPFIKNITDKENIQSTCNQNEISENSHCNTTNFDKIKSMKQNFDLAEDFECDNVFLDDWCLNEFDDDERMLDLSTWQRCQVLECSWSECHTKKVLRVRQCGREDAMKTAICWVRGYWIDFNIQKDDIVSVIAVHSPEDNKMFLVDDLHGLIVTQPDLLISGTAVMGSLFCKRKAVLQDKFRGVDAPNKAMVIGSIVHQLFQVTLSKHLEDMAMLTSECERIMESKDVVYALHDAAVIPAEAAQEVMKYAPHILAFVHKYVKRDVFPSRQLNKQDWHGTVESIIDIEENIWSPHIGVKGKIDVTLEVTVHDRKGMREKRLMPLELKTGRPTVSPEHRGQVILYNMMLEHIKQAIKPHNTGLLLYLKDAIGLHEISAGHVEKRDLLMLRNELAHYLSNWLLTEDSATTEDSPIKRSVTVELPDPINHHSACGKCPYLTICYVYLKASEFNLPDNHYLKRLEETALGHLTPDHISYFLRWTRLICLEEKEATTTKPLKNIWTMSPLERERIGKCVIGVKISGDVVPEGDRYYHCFVCTSDRNITNSSLQIGEYAVVSTADRFVLAAGSIIQIHSDTLSMLLERDLTKRNNSETIYNIDTYETQALVTFNLTNLGLLVENNDISRNLRSIIINKRPATFDSKISRSTVDTIKDILKKLNSVQQRATLKTLAMQDYLLIRGMPGTGKTQTIVALIEILNRLGKKVLVTSHTHSAVDNIFMRLKDKNIKLLRLGSSKRIHRDLLQFSEGYLMQGNPQDLIELYSKAQIVGVTCLGSNHSLLSKRCFDVCIVDESTQVLQPSILRPLLAAKKFVLVGDPDQLPPIVRSQKLRALGFDESLFHRLDCEDSTTSLSLQYRMNRPIMDLANHLTYKGHLKAANLNVENATLFSNIQKKNITPPEEHWLGRCLSGELEDSVLFLDTGNTKDHRLNHSLKSDKYKNMYEATVVLKMVDKLIKLGVDPNHIGVIAPYRDQIVCLKDTFTNAPDSSPDNYDKADNVCDGHRCFQDVEVNTVDQFQGRDKMVVMFSCTKSRSKDEKLNLKSTENEILDDHRRLTVAVTRAKHKLIIVGDGDTLKSYAPFSKLMEGIKKCGHIITLADSFIS